MPKKDFNKNEVDKLINDIFDKDASKTILRRKFDKRLEELNITFNQAEVNLEIGYRTLNGILDSSLERIDFLSLLKIGQFLNMPYEEVVESYTKDIASKHKDDLEQSEKRTFILNNFDLPSLKSVGIIDSIRDFQHIELRLVQILGLQSILDYNEGEMEVVFSSGSKEPKDNRMRRYFIKKSKSIFKTIANPHKYEKELLIEYVPKIRWHSIDKENGLIDVIKSLYRLGITVIFQPRIPALQLRGATFSVNDKPCIVLTDYKGYYPTFWFALLHEIFHVIFDWEEICLRTYHLSDEENDIEVVKQKEEEANQFAREFMFPKEKMEKVGGRIYDRLFIREYAIENHVHPSVIYANFAYDYSTADNNLWKKFNILNVMPPISGLISKLSNGLDHTSKAIEYAAFYKLNIFNNGQ